MYLQKSLSVGDSSAGSLFAKSKMARKEKEKKKDYLLKRQAKDYAKASTIHGLVYIAEEHRPIFET